MKILHVSPFFSGGVGNVALNLTKELVNIGHEIVLATPSEIPWDIKHHVSQCYSLRNPTLKDPFYSIQFYVFNCKKIEEIVKLERPDILLTHGPLVILAKAPRNLPTVSIIHGTYINEVKWMIHHPMSYLDKLKYILSIYTTNYFDIKLYKCITKLKNVYLVAVSKKTREELIKSGTRPNRVFSILNGVDKEKFKPINKDHAKLLLEKRLRIELGNKIILLHVNPGPRKGTHILLKAIDIFKDIYGNDLYLFIVGKTGPKSFEKYLEKMIKNLHLEKNVKMLGWVDENLLVILYNSADLTIVPSYSEGSPLVIAESIACGTPVIATNVGGNPEYLKLVQLEDFIVELKHYDFSKDLSSKILKFVSSRDKFLKLRNSYQFLIPSWNEVSKKLSSLFETFLIN